MAPSLAPLHNRFPRRWFVSLIALFVLASALALANDESWPYPLNTYTYQGQNAGWHYWTRQLPGTTGTEEFWCFDADNDSICERWIYQHPSGERDVCENPSEGSICNYRKRTTADGSYVERFDNNWNGVHEYVHIVNSRGAEQMQWNDDSGREGFVREITRYSLPGETYLVQDYQISPFIVRWFEGGALIEQTWDTNADGQLDAYCNRNYPGCYQGVALTPGQASTLVADMTEREGQWQQRLDRLLRSGNQDELVKRYLDLQLGRASFVDWIVRALANQADFGDYRRSY